MKCSAAVSCTRHTTVLLHFTVLLHCSASPHSLDTQLSCALIDLTQLCSTPLHTMVHHHFSSHHHLSAKLCKFLRRCMQGIMVQHLKYGYICMLTALTSNWTLHSANWTHIGLGLRKVLKKVLKKALKKILLTQKRTQKSKCTFLSTQKSTQ